MQPATPRASYHQPATNSHCQQPLPPSHAIHLADLLLPLLFHLHHPASLLPPATSPPHMKTSSSSSLHLTLLLCKMHPALLTQLLVSGRPEECTTQRNDGGCDTEYDAYLSASVCLYVSVYIASIGKHAYTQYHSSTVYYGFESDIDIVTSDIYSWKKRNHLTWVVLVGSPLCPKA